MSIVYDVVVNGKITETIKPSNQRLREMMGFMFDRVEELKVKHGDNFTLCRRVMYQQQ